LIISKSSDKLSKQPFSDVSELVSYIKCLHRDSTNSYCIIAAAYMPLLMPNATVLMALVCGNGKFANKISINQASSQALLHKKYASVTFALNN